MAEVSRNPYSPADFTKKYASGDLEFEPGSKFAYNNSGYFLLGAIIEKVTGKPYAQVVNENIFVPLGMKNSGYDTASPLIAKRAGGYVKTPQGYLNAPYLDMSLPYAAGSLYSTVEDLYLWDQALYGDKVISAKSKELMFKPGLENYGYGVESKGFMLGDKKTTVPVIRHSGGINGFNSNIVRFVADRHLIVLLDNTSQGNNHGRIISAIANILYNQPYEMPKRAISETVFATFTEKGLNEAIRQYREIKAGNSKEYDLGEEQLNTVGYQLLRSGKLKEAGEIFKLNVEMFPQASNPYDSLAEYYDKAGEKELAIKNYKRALELDPKNANAAAAVKRLEGTAVPAADPAALAAYVGKYEIAPEFVLTITTADGKLYGQATGQPQFTLEPVSENKFSISVVVAEIDFTRDAKGAVTGLVLHQGGRDIPANRVP
jgi:tetratricopeptide (TPR) repeat protein